MPVQPFSLDPSLSDPLPDSPLELFASWLKDAEAKRVQERWDAFVLATCDPEGRPDARVLLCKGIDLDPGRIVFYTNRQSPKSEQLDRTPYATAVFHWDALTRQARLSGPVEPCPDAVSDAYWATRPRISQLSAWASDQSRAIGSREAFLARYDEQETRFAGEADVPRPPHWGGYYLTIESAELWIAGDGRIHDRAHWTRRLTSPQGGEPHGPWTVERLQP